MMEVFAGYAAHVDHHMGRIIDAVKKLPDADNTIFIYIVGDNGASAEGGLEGSLNENLFFNGFPEKWQDNLKDIDELGGPKWFNHFPAAWAHAMNTPFQWTKQVASHFGGTRNPMIISWPAKIKDKGGLRTQFLTRIDIVPTLYEAIGITPPTMLNGMQQKPIEGVSFAYTFDDAKAKGRRTTQYFEMGVNRGIYHDGWMASAAVLRALGPIRGAFDPDREVGTLQHRRGLLAGERPGGGQPGEAAELEDLWWEEAAKYNVLPLDWRAVERLQRRAEGPAEPRRPRRRSPTTPARSGCPSGVAAGAEQVVDDHRRHRDARGGGRGHDRHARRPGRRLRPLPARGQADVRLQLPRLERSTIAGKDPLPKGKAQLAVDFAYDGGGAGKGATVTLPANGKKVGEGRAGADHPAPVLARRGGRRRHGRWLGGGLHLQAAVRLHRQDREGDRRTQVVQRLDDTAAL